VAGRFGAEDMQDLSSLAKDSLGVKAGSMAATNTISEQPDFGAPGTDSESVTSDDIQSVREGPSNSAPIKPGTDGKPQASGQQGWSPSPPAWK